LTVSSVTTSRAAISTLDRPSATAWLLAGIVVLTVALGIAAVGAVRCPAVGCGQDPAKVSLTGVEFGQAVVAILGVLAASAEYSTGMIRTTLTALPRRTTVLAAKAAVVGCLVLVAAAPAVTGSVLVGRSVLPGNGFTAAHGYAALSFTDGPVLRAAVGSVLYLVLIGLFSLGVATAVRDAALAVDIVLAVLYLFPVVAAVVGGGQEMYRHLEQIGPMTAGLAVQATVNVGAQPIAPWTGLGVLAAWAAGGLLAGWTVLRLRDA
jgi:ABC-2 type transport system permease protein